MKNVGICAFVAGMVAGAVVAMLTSPVSGRELRRKIKEHHLEEKEKWMERLESLHDKFTNKQEKTASEN